MTLFRLAAPLAVSLAALGFGLAAPATAQDIGPGQHFVENWDADGDGAVTLAEATEKRDLLFAAFDADEDGFLSAEEYALFDEMRASDQAAAREEMGDMGNGQGNGKGKGQGMGQGNGKGKGPGQGGGKGLAMGMGFGDAEAGMARGFNDADGDGRVARDEFVGRTPDWFAMMDRNGDGVITTADFGRG